MSTNFLRLLAVAILSPSFGFARVLDCSSNSASDSPCAMQSSTTSLLNPPKKPQALRAYTAIGDSYAAGDSNLTAIPNDPNPACKRREEGYPYLFYKKYASSLSAFHLPACSGANTNDTQTQIDGSTTATGAAYANYTFGTPDIVSITVGGDNNNIFSNTIQACILHLGDCPSALNTANNTINTIQPSLEAVYQDAKNRNLAPAQAQNRAIYVLGYAQLYNAAALVTSSSKCGDFPKPSASVAAQINSLVLRMNSVIKAATQSQGVTYVDIDAGFEGHRVCDNPANGGVEIQDSLGDYFRYRGQGYSPFHPTGAGYASMKGDLARAVGFE